MKARAGKTFDGNDILRGAGRTCPRSGAAAAEALEKGRAGNGGRRRIAYQENFIATVAAWKTPCAETRQSLGSKRSSREVLTSYRAAWLMVTVSLLLPLGGECQMIFINRPWCMHSAAAHAWPAWRGHGLVLPGFRFGTGETLPELRLHYLTLGRHFVVRAGHVHNAVLLLHDGGPAHSAESGVCRCSCSVPARRSIFTKYFLILPDDIGHGKLESCWMEHAAVPHTTTTTWCAATWDATKIDHLRRSSERRTVA